MTTNHHAKRLYIGTTAERATLGGTLDTDSKGIEFFDETLGVKFHWSGTAWIKTGTFPRTVAQNTQPAAGTGPTQIDSGEQIIWIDTDDADRCYIMYNYAGAVHIIEIA